jgi:hypothetical protein
VYLVGIIYIILSKVWVQSSKPYPIRITLKQIQEILDMSKPMDVDYFNMAVRMIADDKSVFFREPMPYYLDLRFCVCIQPIYPLIRNVECN